MESIEELKRAVEGYYEERFKYEEQIEKLVEYGTSLLHSIDRDPELFLSSLNVVELHMYIYVLKDYIKYLSEQTTITIPAEHPGPKNVSTRYHATHPILPRALQRQQRAVLPSNLELWPFNANVTEVNRSEDLLASQRSDGAALTVLRHSTPLNARQISKRPRFINIVEEFSSIQNTPVDDMRGPISSTTDEVAHAQPTEKTATDEQSRTQSHSHSTSRQYLSIEPFQPALGPNVVHSTPITSLPERQLFMALRERENVRNEQLVGLPDLEEDDNLVREFEKMFATRRRERKKRALVYSPPVYKPRKFNRIRMRVEDFEQHLDFSNFIFSGEKLPNILDSIEILMENTIRLPLVPRRPDPSQTANIEPSIPALITPTPSPGQFREGSFRQQPQITQQSVILQEQDSTPAQLLVSGQVKENTVVHNSGRLQLPESHLNSGGPLAEIPPVTNRTVLLENDQTTTPEAPEAIITSSPHISRSSPRNWSEILRERNVETQPIYESDSHPVHRRRKRRRLFGPEEDNIVALSPIEELNVVQEMCHDTVGYELYNFREQFRQWKETVLANAQSGRFLNVPKYSIRLSDSLDLGKEIFEILRTIQIRGNVEIERSAILPKNLSRREAVKRIRALLELRSRNILRFLSNGTEITGISLC